VHGCGQDVAVTVSPAAQPALPGRPPRVVWLALVGLLVVVVVRRTLHLGGPAVTHVFDFGGHCGIMWIAAFLCIVRAVKVRAERAAWGCIAAAMVCNALGETIAYALWPGGNGAAGLPDVFWLAYYPFVIAGLALLARERIRAIEFARLGDGLQAALIVASIGLIVVFFPILDRSSSARHTAALIDIVYPICDLVVVGVILGVYALSGFRPGRSWTFVAAGLVLFVVVDTLYAVEVINNSYSAGLLNGGWPAASLLIAYAAWLPEPTLRAVRADDWRTVILPEAVCMIAIALQLTDYLGVLGETPRPALLLLVGAQVVFFAQLAAAPLAARASRREDPTSGLGNQLALARDLDRIRAAGAPPSVLVLCELRGLEELVRRDGRRARAKLLETAAAALEERFGSWTSTYRGEVGDFWVLAPRRDAPAADVLAADASEALSVGLPVVAATVLVPEDGDDQIAAAEARLPPT
jgi:hypothetical protein